MIENRRAIVTAACVAATLLSLFATLNSYRISADNAERFPDSYGIVRAELRMAPLAERLPAGARVAYFTDIDSSHEAYAAAFLAAQYALAPRQLLMAGKGASAEWAMGNFSKPVDFSALGAERGYRMVEDLGNGVVLYRRKAGQ
jgi:1,6-anhydro-N-acetylmuramate kinase